MGKAKQGIQQVLEAGYRARYKVDRGKRVVEMVEAGNKRFRLWKNLEIACVVLTLALMLFVWPLHPFKELASVRSGDDGHVITAPLKMGESITQSFLSPQDNIVQLEFVLTCEEEQPRGGELLFEFLGTDGSVLYQQVYQYNEIPDYGYGGPVLNEAIHISPDQFEHRGKYALWGIYYGAENAMSEKG